MSGGFERALGEVIGGVITSTVMVGLASSFPSMLFLFSLISWAGMAVLAFAMPYWGTTYIIGWLFGMLILVNSGLIGFLDGLVYFGVPIAILVLRVKNWTEDF